MITCRAPEKSCGVAYILGRVALRFFGIKILPILPRVVSETAGGEVQ